MTACSPPESPRLPILSLLVRQPTEDMLLVHTPQYVEKLKTGTLSAREQLELEVPYSPELVRAFWLTAGGSILAADHALNDGMAISIGGGFHHAFPDHGEGFCVIHDVAIAIRRMQRDGKIHTGDDRRLRRASRQWHGRDFCRRTHGQRAAAASAKRPDESGFFRKYPG